MRCAGRGAISWRRFVVTSSTFTLAQLVANADDTALADQRGECAGWAGMGECENNPSYMSTVCAESCAARAAMNCGFWASQGECENNPEFMAASCARACDEAGRDDEDEVEKPESEMTIEERIKNHPGGARCFYDALAMGCPTAITSDHHQYLCGCDYADNSFMHALAKFMKFFQAGRLERHKIVQMFDPQPAGGGVVSIDAGFPFRLQCGAPLANAYPGTNLEVSSDEVYRFLGSFLYPEVRQKLVDICIPGRIGLQLICQHVLIHYSKDYEGARAYAKKAEELFSFIDGCVLEQTPWPFKGLKSYLRRWKGSELPSLSKMAWYPDPQLLRANTNNPCVPIQSDCFPPGAPSLQTSCADCCDLRHGPRGNSACFDAAFTFERCCQPR
eukprot:TRINITY_DN54795_c0_g1_i1.p1 TRINITY_DN54795_c0_g1~~TRINITY_DN54795_c0_g1_i1.p1  ORF type:complete len:405 (-),score=42.27 TRINITY_DN54795_c0_g1_i1:93-1256(-)